MSGALARRPRLRNDWGRRPATMPPGAAPQEKLRSLAMQAVENVEAAVQGGDLRASIEVLKAIGLYGAVAPTGAQDPYVRLRDQVNAEVAREGLDHDPMGAMVINRNIPRLYQRKQEIEAELRARYLDHA
jgi:hypothetical protein